MTWKKVWNDKAKREPNKLQKNPTIAFRSSLNPETLGYIRMLSSKKCKSRFINQAIEMKYFYDTNKKSFLRQLMQSNFDLCKYLLRKIGGFAVTNK